MGILMHEIFLFLCKFHCKIAKQFRCIKSKIMNQITSLILFLFLMVSPVLNSQSTPTPKTDSTTLKLSELSKLIKQSEIQRNIDSMKQVELEAQMTLIKASNTIKYNELQEQLKQIKIKDSIKLAIKSKKMAELRAFSKGYAVAPFSDTILYIYTKIGPVKPAERAQTISNKLNKLMDLDFFNIDSILLYPSENSYDIIYGDMIIMSVTEWDALWLDTTKEKLSTKYLANIKSSLTKQREETSIYKTLLRASLTLLILLALWYFIHLVNKIFVKLRTWIDANKEYYFTGIKLKTYDFLSPEQEFDWAHKIVNLLKWFVVLVLLYFTLPLIFSVFPFTRGWADVLFGWVWLPVKRIGFSIISYLPKLFAIIVIYSATRYFINLIKFFANEVANDQLKINGFHHEWALPTFGIIKFLLYAFMLVIIWPYLPNSDSKIFQGVSVFVGVLFSLGSSSAIANMVAGLVITYMRPFQIGDRIKIGDITGDVLEKTLLVTRIRTIKNEEVTIPNSSILSGHTVNYTTSSKDLGLIIHTTITLGYDIPWKKIHAALIEAANRTDLVLKEPKPFVFQTSLDDFYISYQLNAYIHEAGKQAKIYSDLHANIQDACNENDIEILSPHYRSQRDGNTTTIPNDYLPGDYKAPTFNVTTKTQKSSE